MSDLTEEARPTGWFLNMFYCDAVIKVKFNLPIFFCGYYVPRSERSPADAALAVIFLATKIVSFLGNFEGFILLRGLYP